MVNELLGVECYPNKEEEFEEFIKTDDGFYLVTKYYNGGSLSQLINEHPTGLAPRVLRHLMKKIVESYANIMKKDFLHYISPKKIVLHH